MITGKRRRSGLIGVAVALLAAGCGAAARSAGDNLAAGALARLKAEDTTLIALNRELADSTGAFLQRKFDGAVLGPAQRTWKTMRLDARREADSIAARMEVRVRTGLDDAVGELLSDNLAVLDVRIPELARAVSDSFLVAFGRGLTIQLAPAGDTLVRHIVDAFVDGMENELRPALHTLMLEVRDSLQVRIRDVDRTIAGSSTLSGVRYALMGAGGAILLGALLVFGGHWHRQRRALHALIDAIETGDDDETKRAVQTCAREAGVHGWLSDRVVARRACRDGPSADAAGRRSSGV